MVACAIDDKVQNHQLMLFYGAQGKGKSTFIRRLLPTELGDYYRNGMINPDNKDHLLQLSSCLLINLEEFDTLSSTRMQDLKSLITQDVVTERKVFDIQTYTFIRRAAFIASTNNPHYLPDIGENRRILSNAQSRQTLVTVLEKNNFQTRTTKNGITEYRVVEYSAEERRDNSIRPQHPEQKSLKL